MFFHSVVQHRQLNLLQVPSLLIFLLKFVAMKVEIFTDHLSLLTAYLYLLHYKWSAKISTFFISNNNILMDY